MHLVWDRSSGKRPAPFRIPRRPSPLRTVSPRLITSTSKSLQPNAKTSYRPASAYSEKALPLGSQSMRTRSTQVRTKWSLHRLINLPKLKRRSSSNRNNWCNQWVDDQHQNTYQRTRLRTLLSEFNAPLLPLPAQKKRKVDSTSVL